jgi:hypothetical protein
MPDPYDIVPGASATRAGAADRRGALAQAIPRRAGVSWWLGIVLALSFAAFVTPAITAERWLLRFQVGTVAEHREAPFTVRAPLLAGYDNLRVGGGLVIARGEIATREEAAIADAIVEAMPRGAPVYLAFFALTFVLAALCTHHMRRSIKGRLIRVQVVSLAVIAILAVVVKIVLLATALSALVVPIAALAMVPTLALDRIVGLATGVLAALVVSLLAPFDLGLAILLLVQAATAGLVISERMKRRWLAALSAGGAATLCTAASHLLLTFLSAGHAPALGDPLHSAWLAAAVGPALAAVIAVPVLPAYQVLVGEITQAQLFALEDLGHPLLRQIAERSPGTWQHSLMMANMAEIAANAIGASGRLVRVGAYYHDLGKSLQAKYFIENLEPGEPSPHDHLAPEVSCDAIFAHVTEGIVAARKARLHERIIDFMHMHHGNGVLEYFWVKCREQGNPRQLTIEQFRYPGHPPQSRETAILAICDSVEAASRTLHKPDAAAIAALIQRIVYGKLHLGQLDESGLSMSDLRRISDSLRETIRHANHGRIAYPWQTQGQDANASAMPVVAGAPAVALAAPLADRTANDPAPLAGPDRANDPALGPLGRGTDRLADRASDRVADRAADRDPAPHLPVATVPGRAPGPLPPPPDLITPQSLAGSGAEPHSPRTPIDLPPRPPHPQRPPAVSAAPSAYLDGSLSAAVRRRGPNGHPAVPVPADPAQLAAALANLAERVREAPYGGAVAAADPAVTGTRLLELGDVAAANTAASPVRAMGTIDPRPRAAGSGASDASDTGDAQDAVTTERRVLATPAPARRAPSRAPATRAADDDAIVEPPLGPPASAPSSDRAAPRAGGLVDDLRALSPDVTLRGYSSASAPVGLRERAPSSGDSPWGNGLADRVDAVLESDEWGTETPVVPPDAAELRALLGHPDATRQLSALELEQLQVRAAETSQPALRRSPHPTAEVDPDDIEAAIELAPPARRPSHGHVISAARPKKSPNRGE